MPHGNDLQRKLGLAIKRLIDILVSGFGLLALSPVLALIVLLELLFHGWPPLFQQKRPGLHGKVFLMHKFRSMTNERDASGELLPDEKRLTRFGKFLRASSLDELPELLNVLKGDMSLVGPRPLIVQYLPLYSPRQQKRHDMKPGITGWAQVNGRNATTWKQRLENDVYYVENWSLGLDIKVLLRTVSAVLFREGISAENHATMPFFTGEDDAPDGATAV